MNPWFRYALAVVIAIHGFVYINAARGVLPIYEGWQGRSWLLGDAVTGEALKRLAVTLWAIGGIGLVATALFIAFAPSAQLAWRPLAVIACAIGILSFFVFWDGQSQHLVAQGGVGVVVSLIVLLAALVFPRALGAAR